ncbi:MAG: HAMP domain-containing sensor histidine kinase [Candidatus Margulisiibacteriota bacterium]
MVEPAGLKKSTPPPKPLKIRGRAGDHLSAGIAFLSSQGRVKSSNSAFRQLFGPNLSLCRNQKFLDMLQLSEAELLQLLASATLKRITKRSLISDRSGNPVNVEYKLIREQKDHIFFEISIISQPPEKLSLTGEQQRLIRAGEGALQLTHALKGTSNSFSRALSLLGDQPDPEMFAKLFPVLQRTSQRLSTIINDLLRIGRSGEVEFKEINLLPLLEQIRSFEDIDPRLKRFGVELEISGSCSPIEGVGIELTEAFVCLIDNAIDAILETHRPDGKISIELKNEEAEAGEVTVAVHDNGVGILPEKLADIFRLFFTTKREGSGLGLSFAQKTVEETHGGRIDVVSQIGHGTTFVVHLKQQPPKDRLTGRSSGMAVKIREVRQQITKEIGADPGLVTECLDSMSDEHKLESPVEKLVTQIEWQIKRLQEFIMTNLPHVSVNNFARRTEIVLATESVSAIKTRWIELINHELANLGIAAHCNVAATRKIKMGAAVCRIFEIRKHQSENLTEGEKDALEAALKDKLTPLPTYEEISEQSKFFPSVFNTLLKLDHQGNKEGSLVSLIFTLSVNSKTPRLVGTKVKFHPSDPDIEGLLSRKYGKKLPPAPEILAGFMRQLKGPEDIFSRNEQVTSELLDALGADPHIRKLIGLYNINSALICAFQTVQEHYVINILGSIFPGTIPGDIEKEFLAANLAWKTAIHKK